MTPGKIGLGCVTFGREIDENAAFAIMDYAVEHGITLFDTAESYGGGASERTIGRWLRSRGIAGQVAVLTKITRGLTRSHLRESLDGSLERLGLDCVEIYMLHSFDASVPLEEALAALTEAVAAGKTRKVGASNFSAAQLEAALAISERNHLASLAATEPIYNLAERGIEADLLPFTRSHRIAVISYSPLGAGFLTGKYTPDRAAIPAGTRFHIKPGHADIYFKPESFAIVERLRQMSARTGLPMARLAMGWALSNPDIDCVLVGARSIAHIDNALEALRSPLSPESKAELDSWAGSLTVPETRPR